MNKSIFLTCLLAIFYFGTQAQQSIDSESKRLKISIEYGQQMGIQHQILGISTVRQVETGQVTRVENISGSFGCGMSPGLAVDYNLTNNIQVGFAGDYVFGRTITTDKTTRGDSETETTASLSALRIAPRLSLSTALSDQMSWFARVGIDFVFMAKMKEESSMPFSAFEDFLPDPSLFPDELLSGVSTSSTTTGKFAPGIALQTGIHYRLSDRFGVQAAIEYRGYNFTTKHTELEIEDPNGILGLISAFPFLSETEYVESLGTTSNNESMRNPEDLNLFAPRQDLEQKKPASALGLRVGLTIYL